MYFLEQFDHTLNDAAVEYHSSSSVELKLWNDINWLQKLQREGLLIASFYKLKEFFKMTNEEFARNLSVTWKSISSKKKKERIHGPSTFLALDLMALWDEGLEFFKNVEKFQSWLHTSSPFLDDQSPFQMLDTPAGVQKVRDLVGRMKYGIAA